MRDRWFRKGKKAKPDPAVARAAEANYALAERAQNWNEDIFAKYVVPMLEKSSVEADRAAKYDAEIADLALKQARTADERYRTVGLPAEDAYLKKLAEFSEPEYEAKQAAAATGDLTNAFAVEEDINDRRMLALGMDPTSPAARRAVQTMGLQQAAIRAGVQTRARDAAREAGIGAIAERYNVATGQGAKMLQFGGAARDTVGAGAETVQRGVGVAADSGAGVNKGFGIAGDAYGSNLNSATSIYNTRQQIKAQSSGGLASGLGKLAGLGLTAMMPASAGGGSVLGNLISRSDRRVKKHAKKIVTLAHDIGLWAFRYVWDADHAPMRYGFMADEVERVFPEAVGVDAQGFKTVDYSRVPV